MATNTLAETIDWKDLMERLPYSRPPVSEVENFGREGASMKVRSSSASSACARALHYEAEERAKSDWEESRVDDVVHSNVSQTLMDAGNALESVVLEAAERSGEWKVEHNQSAESVSVEICEGVTLTGHADASATALSDGAEPMVAEVKTTGSSRFARWQNAGTARANPEWTRQLSIYTVGRFGGEEPSRDGVMFVMNRDTGEVGAEVISKTTLRRAFAQTKEKMAALQRGAATGRPPKRAFPAGDWRCKRCPFLAECGNYAEPENADSPMAGKSVKPEDLRFAVEVYAAQKPAKADADKQARSFPALKEAENVIKKHMAAEGLTEFSETSYDGSQIVAAKISERKTYKTDIPALNKLFEECGVPVERRKEILQEVVTETARFSLKQAS